MYAVVGCGECSALWVVETDVETSQCPRCGHRRPLAKRKQFVTTDDEDHAREVRGSMLANRQGHGEAFADLDSFAEMDADAAEGTVDDEAYLEASGLDAGEIAAAGERASEGRAGASGGSSRRETVQAALRDLDRPTEDEVVEYATERGVPADYARRALEKLVRAGEASESRGRYRRL